MIIFLKQGGISIFRFKKFNILQMESSALFHGEVIIERNSKTHFRYLNIPFSSNHWANFN